MSNQSLRQASARAVSGTASTYEGDFLALFADAEIEETTYNGALLSWINLKLGESYTNLPGAMAALAASESAGSWNSLGTFDAVTA